MTPAQKQTQQYLRTRIQTASREQLVLMLYDGAVRFCGQGKTALLANDLEPAHIALTRAQEIILELVYGLDREKGGEIAANLARLYAYCLQRLVQSNLSHDASGVDEVVKIIRGLREAWAAAMDKLSAEGKLSSEPPAPPTPEPAPEPLRAAPVAEAPPPAPAAPARPPSRFLRAAALSIEAAPRLSLQG